MLTRSLTGYSTLAAVVALGLAACKKDAPPAAPTGPARPATPGTPATPPGAPARPLTGAPATPVAINFPGTADGAKALLGEFLKPNSDRPGLTRALKPTAADYSAVFEGDAATKAATAYEKLWNDPRAVIGADPANTELLMWAAKTDELKSWTGEANNFPGGYKNVAQHFKAGLTVYRWKYVKPGEKLGMAYDGLVHVNGRWAWFPKPWRAVGERKETPPVPAPGAPVAPPAAPAVPR
ncbi:MAG: hypothetical protein HYY84_18525 [Deltaproteobacteria bacterium]|nr:hypothetical protein [Deltaproteobacteria bacterium]